jgi:hypothetical protein
MRAQEARAAALAHKVTPCAVHLIAHLADAQRSRPHHEPHTRTTQSTAEGWPERATNRYAIAVLQNADLFNETWPKCYALRREMFRF